MHLRIITREAVYTEEKVLKKVSTLLSRRPFLFEHAQRTKEIEPRRTIQ